jgi:hypothetical protein
VGEELKNSREGRQQQPVTEQQLNAILNTIKGPARLYGEERVELQDSAIQANQRREQEDLKREQERRERLSQFSQLANSSLALSVVVLTFSPKSEKPSVAWHIGYAMAVGVAWLCLAVSTAYLLELRRPPPQVQGK